ncbi:MAG: ABC transporter ATP-binding protein, partial [Bacteroidales bacterium]|nr:ABC transporter ATP-binding protein [Bacteroidales bacterium]
QLKDQEAAEQASGTTVVTAPANVKVKTPKAPRLSFKEKQEFAALEEELPLLEAQKQELETLMSSGTLTGPEIVEKGKLMQQLIDRIDEKEMRWLELSEKA